MAPLALSAVFVAAAAAAAALVGGVAGIDNGLGITPPQGWRSWNVYPCEDNATIVTQARIEAQFAAAVDKSRSVSGVPTSLAELGFDYVSIDDGWQKCNCSTHQDEDPDLPACGDPGVGPMAWHDAAGVPVVNLARFPDMKGMIDKGHTMGLKVGIYLNNCICAERAPHYEQDAAWLVALGFDEVKVDACGGSGDVGKYAALFNASGRPVRIENCHNQFGPDLATGFCPMNMYRSGGDIGAGFASSTAAWTSSTGPRPSVRPLSGPAAVRAVGRTRTCARWETSRQATSASTRSAATGRCGPSSHHP
jgi:hypothetical protein